MVESCTGSSAERPDAALLLERARDLTARLQPLPAPTTPALRLRDRCFDGGHPAVMAIVNRTRDSFFSGNRHADEGSARRAVETAVEQGADIIDIGGVRAGQQGERVDAAEEIRRVVPFVSWVRAQLPDVLLSLDTWRSEVARELGDGGIDLVNDTWAGHDPDLLGQAVRLGAGYVVSHSGGLPPRTDPVDVRYGPDELDVVRDVITTLGAGAARALAAGLPPERILLDPTLDFGKRTVDSLVLVRHTADVAALGLPVMQAISRKDFVGETLDLPVVDRLEGSLAATAVSAWLGATVFRTHDVLATRRVLDMVASVRGQRAPVRAERGVRRAGDADGPRT